MAYYQIEPDGAHCEQCGEWKLCNIWVDESDDAVFVCDECRRDLPQRIKEKLNGE